MPTSPASPPPLPDLSIVIVSWNVRDLLADCLASLARARSALRLDVIVVDGASADGSAAMVAERFRWVHLIACHENVGFPRGNNIGLTHAVGRHVMLLNPDTVVLEGALNALVGYLDDHPDVGVVGPALLNPDGSPQSSRRRFPTPWTAVFESTWLQSVAPRRLIRRYYATDLPDDVPVDVVWVVGAALAVRREAIGQVGDLDAGYYMYSEELDWCRRIKAAGYRVVYLPSAQVVHHVGKSSDQAVTARHINFQRAKLRYFRKYHGRQVAGALRAVLLGLYGWQLLLEGAKGIVGSRRALRWQRVRSYWAVLRSGLTPAGYE